jgi:hypothetical protein
MIGFVTISFKYIEKHNKLLDKLEKTSIRNLYKLGAYAKKIMSRSMRSRKTKSLPGQPPHAHLKSIKRTIRFAVDERNMVVLVGPSRASGSGWDPLNAETVPQGLDRGMRVRMLDPRTRKIKTAVIKPRPFRAPAKEKAIEKLAELIETNQLR